MPEGFPSGTFFLSDHAADFPQVGDLPVLPVVLSFPGAVDEHRFRPGSLRALHVLDFIPHKGGLFRRDAHVYPEAEEALKRLKERHIVTATLSDVAYGMDNEYALEDIRPLLPYIDYPCTSNDTVWRKSSSRSLLVLAEKMEIPAGEIAFVGDEIKDMQCAKGAGAKAVLINRTGETKDYGQDWEITDLREISRMI